MNDTADRMIVVHEKEKARQRARQKAYRRLSHEFYHEFRSLYLQELNNQEEEIQRRLDAWNKRVNGKAINR